MVGSRIRRISAELDKEIAEIARKNNMKAVEASREVARLIKRSKDKKLIREIRF